MRELFSEIEQDPEKFKLNVIEWRHPLQTAFEYDGDEKKPTFDDVLSQKHLTIGCSKYTLDSKKKLSSHAVTLYRADANDYHFKNSYADNTGKLEINSVC